MKDKRIWLVILGILVIGILVTGYTRSVVKKQADSAAFEGEISTEASLGPFKEQTEEEAQKEESGAVQEQAQRLQRVLPPLLPFVPFPGLPYLPEPVPAMARSAVPESGRAATDSQADSPCEGGLYRQRLNDLDAQIQKMQEQERDPNVYSIKTSAETEVKMWDRELNAVYNALLGILPQEEAEELAKEQKEWLINRETAAGQSGKAEGVGSISYAASLVDLTRNRAYELADRYEKEACGPQDAENESDTAVLP